MHLADVMINLQSIVGGLPVLIAVVKTKMIFLSRNEMVEKIWMFHHQYKIWILLPKYIIYYLIITIRDWSS